MYISIATLDPELAKKMEPRASTPARRLATIRELSAAGVPTGLLLAPVVPGLTEHEIPEILTAAAAAGARFAGYTVLRLPHALKQLFDEWLTAHYPGHREKVLGRIRDLRGGQLNDADFASRMTGTGAQARQIRQWFRVARERVGIGPAGASLSTKSFRRPGTADQIESALAESEISPRRLRGHRTDGRVARSRFPGSQTSCLRGCRWRRRERRTG